MDTAPRPSSARFRFLAATLVLLGLAGIVESPLFSFYRISGNSMVPQFKDGDRVLVTSVPVVTGGIHAGDVVIAEVADEVLIKRVVAVPGDRVKIEDGFVYRNGARDDFALEPALRDHANMGPLQLAQNEYYVLGDNRSVSIDSRVFGPLRQDAILAKVLYRFEGGKGAAATAAEK